MIEIYIRFLKSMGILDGFHGIVWISSLLCTFLFEALTFQEKE